MLEEPVVAALPDLHPLAAQAAAAPRATSRASRSSCSRRAGAPGLRAALAPAIDQLGGEDVIMQEVAEMQTVIGLVAAGVGISLVPESVRALMRDGRDLPAAGRRSARRAAGDGVAREPTSRRCSPRSWTMARAAAPAEGERGRRGPALR